MIIHCLSCGKSISSHGCKCPYCMAEMTDITFELNGIEMEKPRFADKFRNVVLGMVTK